LSRLIGLASKRRTEFPKSTSFCEIFSTVEARGANGRFQVRDRDGAIIEIGREADPPIRRLLHAIAVEGARSLPFDFLRKA